MVAIKCTVAADGESYKGGIHIKITGQFLSPFLTKEGKYPIIVCRIRIYCGLRCVKCSFVQVVGSGNSWGRQL